LPKHKQIVDNEWIVFEFYDLSSYRETPKRAAKLRTRNYEKSTHFDFGVASAEMGPKFMQQFTPFSPDSLITGVIVNKSQQARGFVYKLSSQ
jgi:hypothetical protein